jgi:hypothetical protein
MSEEEAFDERRFRRLKEMARHYTRQLHVVHSKVGKPDLLQLAYIRAKAKQGAQGQLSTRQQWLGKENPRLDRELDNGLVQPLKKST